MTEKHIIGITGIKGQGKTSFALVLSYLLSLNGHSMTVLNFADYLKKVANECFGREIGKVHGKLSKDDRKILCDVGDALRAIDEQCLLNIIERKLQKLDGFIIVGDVRLTREADMIKKNNGIVVRVESNVYNRDENYLREHKTETEINELKEDCRVINEGSFTDLIQKGKQVLSKCINKEWLG